MPELDACHPELVEGRPGRSRETEILSLDGSDAKRTHDEVVVEEPLELRLSDGRATRTLAVTMRTPGNDFELAAGFAYGEAIVSQRSELAEVTYCLDPSLDPEQRYNVVTIQCTRPVFERNAERFERHFTVNSACGVCGRAQLDSLREMGITPVEDGLRVAPSLLYELPERMRARQRTFASTGGLHAAALFDERGECLALREDVGRHNAVDKIVGWGLLEGKLPFRGRILLVSGRASYEILQKAARARIPVVAAVSAPSSLAVELARAFNITLAGFLRNGRANVYAAPERIAGQ